MMRKMLLVALYTAFAVGANAGGANAGSLEGLLTGDMKKLALVAPVALPEAVLLDGAGLETSLAQYKIAGYPPDVLINVPKRVCRFFEFYKAPELIALGREIARDTLDKYESEQG